MLRPLKRNISGRRPAILIKTEWTKSNQIKSNYFIYKKVAQLVHKDTILPYSSSGYRLKPNMITIKCIYIKITNRLVCNKVGTLL